MTFICAILAVLCLVYYGVIVIYSGIGTSFSAIWLVLAAAFVVAGMILHVYGHIRSRIPIRLEVSVITILAAIFSIFVLVEVIMGFNFFSLQKQSADYAVVLGAQVRDGVVSRSLEYRLDKAYEYAQVHPNTVLILSGGRGNGEEISEAEAMYDYLKKRGVPEYQMIKEELSSNTYENLLFSKIKINERETARRTWIRNLMSKSGYLVPPEEETPIRVAVITSNFHVYRAKEIAKRVGLPNVSGIASKSDPILFVHLCVRECFAILKDKFLGHM